MERELQQIAARIRRWRVEAELTLQDLADRSAVSASTIHKIENGATVPTIAVLLKISQGLNRRPDELLVDAEAGARAAFTALADRPELKAGEGITLERVAGRVPGSILDLWRSVLEPGQRFGDVSDDATWKYEGEVIVLGEEGLLIVEVGDESYELGPGDSLHFRTDISHGWRNESDAPASAIFFSVVPRGLRGSLTDRLQSLRGRSEPAGP